ncbi:MAG: transposase [Deltaproteobacteria bacterium]|nr:transposase [Deltaproteobacteria bacterium]
MGPLPWELRFLLAMNPAFLTEMAGAFLRTLFAFQRHRGRRLGIRDGQTGSVTFVQRFGGVCNLNPHMHVLVPDGLFVPGVPGVPGVSDAPGAHRRGRDRTEGRWGHRRRRRP